MNSHPAMLCTKMPDLLYKLDNNSLLLQDTGVSLFCFVLMLPIHCILIPDSHNLKTETKQSVS